MACQPNDCFVVVNVVSDPRLETFRNHDGDSREYEMPGPDSGYYTILSFPAMRDRFAIDVAQEMDNYPKRIETGCADSCGCSASTNPDDALTAQRRVLFVTEFEYDNGKKATLKGSFLVTSTRTAGFCTPGQSAQQQPVAKLAEPEPDTDKHGAKKRKSKSDC